MTDYETTCRTFRLQVPDDYEFTRDVVEHWAAQHPGKLALVALDPRGEGRREITFGDLARASRRVANALEGSRHHRRRAGVRDAAAHPGVVRAAARHVPPRRDPDAGHDAVHGARHRPAHRARTGHGRSRRRRGGRQARDGPRRVRLAASRDRRRHAPAEAGDERYDDLLARASDAEPTPRPTRADDPLLLYFTSGTVAAPKMVLHTHASMGAGHEITARFWQDLTPADLHWTFSDTGWAKAAWGKLFGQWRMGASVFLWDQRGKLDPRAVPARARALRRDHVLLAADALPRVRAARSRRVRPDARAPHGLGRRAAQPRGHPRLARGHRHDDLRRLRTDRDRQSRRQLPLPRGAPGLDGQADAGQRRRRRLGRRRAPRARRGGQHRARHRARAAGRPDAGLLARRRRQRRGLPRRLVLHGRSCRQGRGRLPLVRQPFRRRHHLGLVPDRALRGRVRAGRAPGRGRVRSRRQARPGPHEHRQGVRRAGARTRGLGRARARTAGARQDRHGAVQVPARDRVRRRRCPRRSPARSAAASFAARS